MAEHLMCCMIDLLRPPEQKECYHWLPLEQEVRDELIQQHALGTSPGRACTKYCDQERRDCFCNWCCITIFCRLASFAIVISLSALIVLGVYSIGPYLRSPYKVTQCDVVSVGSEQVFNCDCSITAFSQLDCKTKTTCVKVNVEYTREDGEKVQGLLHRTEQSHQCSNNRCVRSSALTMMQDYTPPHSFKCLYDPTKFSTHVMINYSLPTTPEVVHMLFWPIVIIILCIAVAVFLMYTCGCHWYACKPPQDVRTIAANLRLHGIHTLKSLPVEERRRLVRECSPDPEEEIQAPQMTRL